MLKSEAIKHFGSVRELAEVVGLTRQAVYMWPDEVPEQHKYKLHYLSGGKLPLETPERPQ